METQDLLKLQPGSLGDAGFAGNSYVHMAKLGPLDLKAWDNLDLLDHLRRQGFKQKCSSAPQGLLVLQDLLDHKDQKETLEVLDI